MSANVIEQSGVESGKGLRAGALGLLSSVVIAVSSTAPAYSMAATLGLIVAVVGVHAPAMLIVSFLPMLCIAYAFRELNKVDPDCGTTFTWTARAFGPWAGWMGGWGIVAADIIVMASLSQIAALRAAAVAPRLAPNAVVTTLAYCSSPCYLVCYRASRSPRECSSAARHRAVALAIFAVVRSSIAPTR